MAADPIRAYRNHRLLLHAIEKRQADRALSLVVDSLGHWNKPLKAGSRGGGGRGLNDAARDRQFIMQSRIAG